MPVLKLPGAAYDQPRVHMLGFCEFEEMQVCYSQFPGTLGYDISTQ